MAEWPDWRGETAVIVGTGPSANVEPLDIVRGQARVITIKSTWKLAPWADVLYGIDRGWWIANKGVPAFSGLKVSPSPTVCKLYGAREVRLKVRAEILTARTGEVGCGLPTGGGNSGFQAINLAVQFGAKRILLVGFDMTLKHGSHWTDDMRGVGKPDPGRVESWRKSLDDCAPQFHRLGVEVINCSLKSALKAYPKRSLAECFARAAA